GLVGPVVGAGRRPGPGGGGRPRARPGAGDPRRQVRPVPPADPTGAGRGPRRHVLAGLALTAPPRPGRPSRPGLPAHRSAARPSPARPRSNRGNDGRPHTPEAITVGPRPRLPREVSCDRYCLARLT